MGCALGAPCAKGLAPAEAFSSETVRVETRPWAALSRRPAVEIGVVSLGVACGLSPSERNYFLARSTRCESVDHRVAFERVLRSQEPASHRPLVHVFPIEALKHLREACEHFVVRIELEDRVHKAAVCCAQPEKRASVTTFGDRRIPWW